LLPGVTDARHFNALGIQGYGYIPMNLPPDYHLQSMLHAADERIPVDALNFGTTAMFEVLRRYGRG
jgi:acetylornithine deacetylase/succinyl-diaminopimelate desuccinylase-like protein